MILYHGTNVDFEQIDLTKSNRFKDFGQGFYLTDIKRQAVELAENGQNVMVVPPSCKSMSLTRTY